MIVFNLDTLSKSAPGATRGPKAGHKYIRRARVFFGGKLQWKYYYADQKARQQRIDKLKAEAAARLKGRKLRAKEKEIEALNADIASYKDDFAHIHDRKEIGKLSTQDVERVLEWPKGEEMSVSFPEKYVAKYHQSIVDKGEGDNLLSDSAISPLRALEIAQQLLPPVARTLLKGQWQHTRFTEKADDSYMVEKEKAGEGVGGYSEGGGTVVLGLDVGGFTRNGGVPKFTAGAYGVDLTAHEIAHQLEFKLEEIRRARKKDPEAFPEYTGPMFSEWISFYNKKLRPVTVSNPNDPSDTWKDVPKGGEATITKYAEGDPGEGWAESFACLMTYPKQLASDHPQTYDLLYKYMDGRGVRPRVTDKVALLAAQNALLAAKGKDASPDVIAGLEAKVEEATGLDILDAQDPRLAWWKPKETKVQKLIRETPVPVTFEDRRPEDPDGKGDKGSDRFFEWSVNGRTVYFRAGASTGGPPITWDPDDPTEADTKLKIGEAKEIWAEDGTRLNPQTVWWWLNQDVFTDDHPLAKRIQAFAGPGSRVKGSPMVDNQITQRLHSLTKKAHKVISAKTKPEAKAEILKAKEMLPVEMTFNEFRLRSGTFVFDEWALDGEDLLKKLSNTPDGHPDREALMREYRQQQPYAKRIPVEAGGTGFGPTTVETRVTKGMGYGPYPVPVMHAIRYTTPMPDGSKFTVSTAQDPPPAPPGFRIYDPVLRALLTPNGEAIQNAKDLEARCRWAAQQKRTSWVSIPYTTGGKGSSAEYHVKVMFDGRGSPRLMGQYWIRTLGKAEPRLEDLLKSTGRGEEEGTERRRAKVVGPPIRTALPFGAKKKSSLPKEVGERFILNVRGAEIARVHDRKVPVFVKEILKGPPKKFVLESEKGSGFVNKRFVRGTVELRKDMVLPILTAQPVALAHAPLVYIYREHDRLTGEEVKSELRLKLPTDGSVSGQSLGNFLGAEAKTDNGDWRINLDRFGKFREDLGSLVMTPDATALVEAKMENLQELIRASDEVDHVFDIADLDPGLLADLGVDISTHVYGNKFVLPAHQKRLVQKAIDNLLLGIGTEGAHFMGTGKTISALTIVKLCQAIAAGKLDSIIPPELKERCPKRICILAPLNTVDQWNDAFNVFDGGATVIGARSTDVDIKTFMTDPKYRQSDVVVVGPEYWTKHEASLREAGFDGIVVDEAHQGLGSGDTARTKAMKRWNPDMKLVLLLTGTPITTSPVDILQHVQLASKGLMWNEYDAASWTEEFLMESPQGAITGARVKKGPKLWIKPEKLDEVAAVFGTYADIALSKDVKGKVMPALGIELNKHVEMTGTQSSVYSSIMGRMSPEDLALMSGGIASPAELARMSAGGTKNMNIARAVSNNPAYKAASKEPFVRYEVVTVERGVTKTIKRDLEAPNPDRLFNKDARPKGMVSKSGAKWPISGQEIEGLLGQLWGEYFPEVFDGKPYEAWGGKRITKKQIAYMKKKQWSQPDRRKVTNPDQGPVGIRARGRDIELAPDPRAQEALGFQRAYADLLVHGAAEELPEPTAFDGYPNPPYTFKTRKVIKRPGMASIPKGAVITVSAHDMDLDADNIEVPSATFKDSEGDEFTLPLKYLGIRKKKAKEAKVERLDPEVALKRLADGLGYDLEDARSLLAISPKRYRHLTVVKRGGVEIHEGDFWPSDTRGSLHLPHRSQDWNYELNRPKVGGKYETANDGDFIEVAGFKWPKDPDTKEVVVGRLRLEATLPPEGKKVAATDADSGEDYYVDPKKITVSVRNLYDVGMRSERDRWDLANTTGNAKVDALKAELHRFFMDSKSAGPDGERSFVLFGAGILESVRTMESALRTMGFMDVNEAIKGSKQYDPSDPRAKKGAPNGKYFSTFIGGTYTGERSLNSEIFKKVKNKLGGDSGTSVFVNRTATGRKWQIFAGDKTAPDIMASRWSPEERRLIKRQFDIESPQAFVKGKKKRDGTREQLYFYGNAESRSIEKKIAKSPDPTKLAAPEGATAAEKEAVAKEASAIRDELIQLKTRFAVIAKKGAIRRPPLTTRQSTIFNNCVGMVASDAARVGLNWGHATELVNYDQLASPQLMAQRMTRAARMLNDAVPKQLLDKQIAKVRGQPKGAGFRYASLPTKPNAAGYVEGATKDHAGVWTKGGKIAVEVFEDPTAKLGEVRWVTPKSITFEDGPFKKIQEKESKFLQVRHVAKQDGVVVGATIAGEAGRDSRDRRPPMTFNQVMDRIAWTALGALGDDDRKAQRKGNRQPTLTQEQRANLASIQAKARFAQALGTGKMRATLDEFRGMPFPGRPHAVLDFSDENVRMPTKTSNQYAPVVATEATAAIQKEIDGMSVFEKRGIMSAGFVEAKNKDRIDATSVYLALRAGAILDRVNARLPELGHDLRGTPAGAAVTDEDVMNSMLEEISPEDQAVLKTKKYLVNVRNLTTSATVAKFVGVRTQGTVVDEVTGQEKEGLVTKQVFVGYENQSPIQPDVMTAVMSRARMTSVEALWDKIQTGAAVDSGLEFKQTMGEAIADMSSLHKSEPKLVFRLGDT